MLSDISELVKDSLDGAERIKATVADLKNFAQPCEQQADKIIREHGGTINVSSRPGAGSSLTVRIPINPNTG